MTVGLRKAILPICKPTSRVKIQENKRPRTHYFMHCINSIQSENERISAIDQGFTCLATQSLPLEGLEGYLTLARLN
jgi:hypothetical protein